MHIIKKNSFLIMITFTVTVVLYLMYFSYIVGHCIYDILNKIIWKQTFRLLLGYTCISCKLHIFFSKKKRFTNPKHTTVQEIYQYWNYENLVILASVHLKKWRIIKILPLNHKAIYSGYWVDGQGSWYFGCRKHSYVTCFYRSIV